MLWMSALFILGAVGIVYMGDNFDVTKIVLGEEKTVSGNNVNGYIVAHFPSTLEAY